MTGTSGSGTNRETVRSIVQQWTASTVLVRLIVLILLWLVLSEGEVRYWGVILGGVVAAALVSLLLAPTTELSLSPVGLARFVPFFLMQSVLGGWDVALRALSRSPRLDPVYVECRLRLDAEPVRVLVANT